MAQASATNTNANDPNIVAIQLAKKHEDTDAEKAHLEEEKKKQQERKTSTDLKAEADREAARKAAKEKRIFRKQHPSKIRIKLPTIDSYEKELEYTPDVPGRIQVRLERLMGTDRVRITDPKYLKALLLALEAEEEVVWKKRSKQRKLAERNRFRQLAIDGHMDPGPDMQDLYQHPVFRVNRILNRLAKFDTHINHATTRKLPPINPVEPFDEYDETGRLFYFHPNHYLKVGLLEEVEDEEEVDRPKTDEEHPFEEDAFRKGLEAVLAAREFPEGSTAASPRTARSRDEWGGEDYIEEEEEETKEPEEEDEEGDEDGVEEEEEEEDEDTEESGKDADECRLEVLGRGSLSSAKAKYSISEDLVAAWKPFRSELIDQVYDEDAEGGAAEMYEFAKAVIGTYKRENLKTDDFVNKELRLFT